jgi:hypothetical protein
MPRSPRLVITSDRDWQADKHFTRAPGEPRRAICRFAHQQIRAGVAQVHCEVEGSARNPIAAITRHTRSMPDLSKRRNALPLFRPTLADPDFVSARTMKRRVRRSNSERQLGTPSRPNAPLQVLHLSDRRDHFTTTLPGLSGISSYATSDRLRLGLPLTRF